MTGFGTVEAAIEAVREGACDFLYKPFEGHELLLRVAMAMEKRRLVRQVRFYKAEHQRLSAGSRIVGQSAAVRTLLEKVARVGPTDATVLITGESGTGKELVARELHEASRRSEQPFIAVNCAAITETLLESELFGHAKGAFTGAVRARRGHVRGGRTAARSSSTRLARPRPGFQVKLLRVLQEGEIRRVGESTSDQGGRPRHRRHQPGPQARHRREALPRGPLLPAQRRAAAHPPAARAPRGRPAPRGPLPRAASTSARGTQKVLGADAIARLKLHEWPGNVRELENIIEQAASLSLSGRSRRPTSTSRTARAPAPGPGARVRRLSDVVEEAERRAIEEALARCGGDQGRVAKELGVSPTTLWRRMKRLGLSGDRRPPEAPSCHSRHRHFTSATPHFTSAT